MADSIIGTVWLALNPSTWPGRLTVTEQYHTDEEIDNWVQTVDDQGGGHMMSQPNLEALYTLEVAPEVEPAPAPAKKTRKPKAQEPEAPTEE